MPGKFNLNSDSKNASIGNRAGGKKLPSIPADSSWRRKKPKRLLGKTTAVEERSLPSRFSSTRAQVRSTRSSWRPISSSMGPPRPRRGRCRGESRGISGPGKAGATAPGIPASGRCARRFFPAGLEVDDQDLVRADLQAVQAPEFRHALPHCPPLPFRGWTSRAAAEEAKTSSRHRKSATAVDVACRPAGFRGQLPHPGSPAARDRVTSPRRERRSWMRSPRSAPDGRAALRRRPF